MLCLPYPTQLPFQLNLPIYYQICRRSKDESIAFFQEGGNTQLQPQRNHSDKSQGVFEEAYCWLHEAMRWTRKKTLSASNRDKLRRRLDASNLTYTNRDWCEQTRKLYLWWEKRNTTREKASHQARRNRCKQARHHWAGGSAWLYACGILCDAMNLLYYLGYSLDFWPACIYKSIVWRAELPDTVNSIDIHHCSRRHTWNSLAAIRRMQQLEDSE